ncbi:MAG TPA: hypothetical protein VGD81_10615 [Opitutaceae bacterium]
MKKFVVSAAVCVLALLGITGCTTTGSRAAWSPPPGFAKGTYTVTVEGDHPIATEEYLKIQQEIAQRLAGSGLTPAAAGETPDYVINVTLRPTYEGLTYSRWWFDDPYFWGPFGYRSWAGYSYYPYGYFGHYTYGYPYLPPRRPHHRPPPVVVQPPPPPPSGGPGIPPPAQPPVRAINGRIPLARQHALPAAPRAEPRPSRNDAINGRMPMRYVRHDETVVLPPPQAARADAPRPIRTERTGNVRAVNGRVPFSSRQNDYRPDPPRHHVQESRSDFSPRSESRSSSTSSSASSSPSSDGGSSAPRAINGRIPMRN